VIGVHIAAPHVYLPPGYGFWLRRQQVQALEAHFDEVFEGDDDGDGRGTLMLGDFNATPLWPVYRRLSAHFTDAAIAVGQRLGRPARPSWGTRPGGPRLFRIDHAFTRGVHARELQVVPIAGSDHSAVVVDLET
jgi:endonuclease/exonuclease/phosphatase (EEP) superfamily protein YafD